MQKSLIIILALCLLSVHAFVKRDAPAAAPSNVLEDAKKVIDDFTKTASDKFKETFNPDEIKKAADEFVSKLNKALEDIKPKGEQKKE